MYVPQGIIDIIRKCARQYAKANRKSTKIRDWLYKRNLLNEENEKKLIDCIITGKDPDAFIKYIESPDCQYGNRWQNKQ